MFDFPVATAVHRRMPKETFYRHLPFTRILREKFISEVDRLFVEYSFTKESLNLTVDSEIKEILVLSVYLKKQEFDAKIAEAIAKQNPHKLVFLFRHEEKYQFALYHGKLYRTPWMSDNEMQLTARGFSLDEIWTALIEQIALYGEKAAKTSGYSVDERIALQEQINKLEKKIEKAEIEAWKEQQPKKQFGLYSRLQTYKKKLEELKGGQNTPHSGAF